jgi:hypothetical protein
MKQQFAKRSKKHDAKIDNPARSQATMAKGAHMASGKREA